VGIRGKRRRRIEPSRPVAPIGPPFAQRCLDLGKLRRGAWRGGRPGRGGLGSEAGARLSLARGWGGPSIARNVAREDRKERGLRGAIDPRFGRDAGDGPPAEEFRLGRTSKYAFYACYTGRQ
jgi:hypothetical protein